MKKMKKKQEGQSFTNERKLEIIEEYLTSGLSMEKIEHLHGIKGHGVILRWMTKFGLTKSTNNMTHETLKDGSNNGLATNLQESLEKEISLLRENISHLNSEIGDLKDQLSDSRLQTKAKEMLILVAEKKFSIDIRKKRGAKQ